jgi:hypothetical protein
MHALTRFGLCFLLSSFAACVSEPPKKGIETIPIDGAQITFWNHDRQIRLSLDSHDSVELVLVGSYKEFKDGTRFRLCSAGKSLYLVVEKDQ